MADVPDNFKDWVKDNSERIESAQQRGTLSYFIRDNYGVVDETIHPELKERRLREEAEKRAKEEAKWIAMEEAGQVVSNVLPICEATTPKEAIDFILENIADNCSLDIKKKDLPIINEVINQLNQRNHEYGLGKFKDFGKPRSKGANASWDEHDDSFNFSASSIERAWKAEMKYRVKGISYSACNDSREDYVRYLVDHEYGHRLMSKYQMKTDAIATQTKGWKAMSKISYYSGTDIDEYFAEVFAAYKGSLRGQIGEANLAMMQRLQDKIEMRMGIGKHGVSCEKHGSTAAKQAYKDLQGHEEKHTYSKEQKQNMKDIEKITGWKQGKYMTFEEADSGSANIIGDDENCTACVIAHEFRLRGFDVTANAYVNEKGNIWKIIEDNTQYPWCNKNKNKVRFEPLSGSKEQILSKLNEKTTEVGSRYHLGWDWDELDPETKKPYGHIITVERTKKGLVFYDPQTDDYWNINEIIDRMRKDSNMELLRVDKLLIDPQILKMLVSSH